MPPLVACAIQPRHQLRALAEVSPQKDFNIHALLQLQAAFQSGARKNRMSQGLGDSFRPGPIINYRLGRAEIHVIADFGYREAFLAEPGTGLTGQIFGPGAVSHLNGRVRQFGAGQMFRGRWAVRPRPAGPATQGRAD